MSHYHVDDDLSKTQGVDGDFDWLVINYLCEPIDSDVDWVITVSLPIHQNWYTSDKIHQ